MRGGSSRSLFIRNIVDVPLVKLHSLTFAIFYFVFLGGWFGGFIVGFFWFCFGFISIEYISHCGFGLFE